MHIYICKYVICNVDPEKINIITCSSLGGWFRSNICGSGGRVSWGESGGCGSGDRSVQTDAGDIIDAYIYVYIARGISIDNLEKAVYILIILNGKKI